MHLGIQKNPHVETNSKPENHSCMEKVTKRKVGSESNKKKDFPETNYSKSFSNTHLYNSNSPALSSRKYCHFDRKMSMKVFDVLRITHNRRTRDNNQRKLWKDIMGHGTQMKKTKR